MLKEKAINEEVFKEAKEISILNFYWKSNMQVISESINLAKAYAIGVNDNYLFNYFEVLRNFDEDELRDFLNFLVPSNA